MPRITKLASTLCVVASLVVGAQAQAVPMNFSFTGVFANDDDVRLFSFTADDVSKVRLRTYGFGGGTQADGTVVPAGGFDPMLALFDSSGNLVNQNEDAAAVSLNACGAGVVNADNGDPYDACFDEVLAAGMYQVAIMQSDNFAIGPTLGAGFDKTGNQTYTSNPLRCSPPGLFCAKSLLSDPNRTGAWAFDILGVESQDIVNNVPEPTSLAILGLGLAGLSVMRRRKRGV